MQTPAATIAAVSLPPNPVWRSYTGGRVLREFRGLGKSSDNNFPEDWLASTVRARNGANSQGPDEGLSRLEHGVANQTLAEALERDPQFWFGAHEAGRGVSALPEFTSMEDGQQRQVRPGDRALPPSANRTSTNVLWKLLDSSVRLQLQAHPDAHYARMHLNSNSGKTECWYILGTRGEACVHLGFQRPPSPEAWARMIREQRIQEMLDCFDRIRVQPGDCFVVPAGTPHAIGAGIFMMELQEPTDWVVRCERVNAGVTLPPEACFMGLTLEACLDVFDYESYSAVEIREKFQQHPATVRQTDALTEEEIIRPPWHEFFRLHRLRGTGDADWPGGELMLLILLNGAGELSAGSGLSPVHVCSGETWLLPGAAKSWQWQNSSGDYELLLAKLPLPRKPRAN